MPTTRPRHLITESDELRAALDRAAVRWPELSRPQLVVRLALYGAALEDVDARACRDRRHKAIAEHAGMFTGLYPPDYLTQLREDWPE